MAGGVRPFSRILLEFLLKKYLTYYQIALCRLTLVFVPYILYTRPNENQVLIILLGTYLEVSYGKETDRGSGL